MAENPSRVIRCGGIGRLLLLGGRYANRSVRYRRLVEQAQRLESSVRPLSDTDLKRASRSLIYRARSGEPIVRFVPDALALSREVSQRAIGLRHYDVQLLAAAAMVDGNCVEMITGEGKTLAAVPALYLRALTGRGAHLLTANDYLARRDADWMRPVFERLGLTVGALQASSTPMQRAEAYRCDVTYGTVREFAFDFLRDRLALDGGFVDLPPGSAGSVGDDAGRIQRELHFALVDEADSILMDDARMPLVISGNVDRQPQNGEPLLRWAATQTEGFEADRDYVRDTETGLVELTEQGRRRVQRFDVPPLLAQARLIEMFGAVERAIRVEQGFLNGRDYIIEDDAIVIIDQETGRPAHERQWQNQVHQAIEAKEGLPISPETGTVASVTIQRFIRRYRHLAGMTGTAATERREFKKVYNLGILRVPTNRTIQRTELPTRVFSTDSEKWSAVCDEISQMREAGRPVLVGTRSVTASERLSRLLRTAGVEHRVLNARNPQSEAAIIADAGIAATVTVATNMAGRGTDIMIDETARAAGGLHVIGTELHDSVRIDRQLAGRAGRQGDPGSFRQFLSAEDTCVENELDLSELRTLLGLISQGDEKRAADWFRIAQSRIDRRNRRSRELLLHTEEQKERRDTEMGLDAFLET